MEGQSVLTSDLPTMEKEEQNPKSSNGERKESEEEREKKGSVKTRHKKLKISGKPKETHAWGINSTSQNAPHGHNVYSAATLH